MNKVSQLNSKNTGLLGAIFGGLLISVPATPIAASAQNAVLNPCPRIYYEEPFNSRNLVPEGCPPNAITQQLTVKQQPGDVVAGERAQDLPGANLTPNRIVPADAPTTPAQVAPTPSVREAAPYGATSADPYYSPNLRDQTNPPVTPPLPENRSEPIANVMPMDGEVDVKLKNNTNAVISYQAVGHTGRRFLPGGEEIVLQNLPTPATITTVRQDEGLLKITPVTTTEQGLLEVSLDEEKTLDDNLSVLRIQKDGQVFLN